MGCHGQSAFWVRARRCTHGARMWLSPCMFNICKPWVGFPAPHKIQHAVGWKGIPVRTDDRHHSSVTIASLSLSYCTSRGSSLVPIWSVIPTPGSRGSTSWLCPSSQVSSDNLNSLFFVWLPVSIHHVTRILRPGLCALNISLRFLLLGRS